VLHYKWPPFNATQNSLGENSMSKRFALGSVRQFRHHGGAGRHAQLLGPLIGSAIFLVLQDCISGETENWMSFIALFFVLVVLFFPPGVLCIIQRKAAS